MKPQSIRKSSTSILFALGLFGFALVLPAGARGADLKNPLDIIKRANLAHYYAGKDGRAKVRMTIADDQGRTRIRQMVILRRDGEDGGRQDYLVYFTRPSDVRKTVFLVTKHVKRDDDRWMYLPALDLVKRISAGDKRTSFVGSHFFYEDISGRDVHEDRYKLVKATGSHYVLRGIPKKAGDVEFKSFMVWVDKKTFLPTKLEYLDKANKKYRRLEALKTEVINGYPTITKMKATDLRSGGHTITEMRGIRFDISLPDEVFTERSLRHPPKRWLRGG